MTNMTASIKFLCTLHMAIFNIHLISKMKLLKIKIE